MIKKQHPFTIDHLSEMDGEHYQGQFTTRKINVMDISKINVRKSQLCGGMYCVKDDDGKPTGQGIDETTDMYNYMLAVLENQIIQSPPWWKLSGDEALCDQEVIALVFKEVMAFEATFRGRGNRSGSGHEGQAEGSTKAGSAKSEASAINDQYPKKVVDKQVQAALDA